MIQESPSGGNMGIASKLEPICPPKIIYHIDFTGAYQEEMGEELVLG
jgi:hypothetical protein